MKNDNADQDAYRPGNYFDSFRPKGFHFSSTYVPNPDHPVVLPTMIKWLLAVGVEDKHGDFSGCLPLVLVEPGICLNQLGPEAAALFRVSLLRLDRDVLIHDLDDCLRLTV